MGNRDVILEYFRYHQATLFLPKNGDVIKNCLWMSSIISAIFRTLAMPGRIQISCTCSLSIDVLVCMCVCVSISICPCLCVDSLEIGCRLYRLRGDVYFVNLWFSFRHFGYYSHYLGWILHRPYESNSWKLSIISLDLFGIV